MTFTPDALKTYPDIWGDKIASEKEEDIIIKGIEIRIKKYKTVTKLSGIRVSLDDNKSLFFQKLREELMQADSFRPPEEKAMNQYSYNTLSEADPGLDKAFPGTIKGESAFYIYNNHVIFHEESISPSPIERLTTFVEYYKKKFGIKTYPREETFEELDELEIL